MLYRVVSYAGTFTNQAEGRKRSTLCDGSGPADYNGWDISPHDRMVRKAVEHIHANPKAGDRPPDGHPCGMLVAGAGAAREQQKTLSLL